MPEPCDERACCSGANDIGGIVIADCGSAICSVGGLLPRFYFLPLDYNASVCEYNRFVYSTTRETLSYELSGENLDSVPGDPCYWGPGGSIVWGRTTTIYTPDPYCVDFLTIVEDENEDRVNCAAHITLDPAVNEGLVEEYKTADSWFRRYSRTADGFTKTFDTIRNIQLSGIIDLEAIPGCVMEEGFDTRYKIGCGGVVELLSRTAIDPVNMIGRSVRAGTSVKGRAQRPYRIVETVTTGHCPTTTETTCQDFPLNAELPTADQVDCLTLIPAALTVISVESGACP